MKNQAIVFRGEDGTNSVELFCQGNIKYLIVPTNDGKGITIEKIEKGEDDCCIVGPISPNKVRIR